MLHVLSSRALFSDHGLLGTFATLWQKVNDKNGLEIGKGLLNSLLLSIVLLLKYHLLKVIIYSYSEFPGLGLLLEGLAAEINCASQVVQKGCSKSCGSHLVFFFNVLSLRSKCMKCFPRCLQSLWVFDSLFSLSFRIVN